jgi:hypothetical protein
VLTQSSSLASANFKNTEYAALAFSQYTTLCARLEKIRDFSEYQK